MKKIKKNAPSCPICRSSHIFTCEQYSELWNLLVRLRSILSKIYYGSPSYPKDVVFTDEIKDLERILGKISGYPDCCCEAYVNGKDGRRMDKRINSNYVLCDDCEKILIEEWKRMNGAEMREGNMSKGNISVVPKNTFDMKTAKDKVAELERRHCEIVRAAESCVDKYDKYREMQKELLKSKLPGMVFGDCRHKTVKWDKNRREGGSTGFWVCVNCNEIVGRSYWVSEVNGGWTTREEDKIVDKIVTEFYEEYPDIDTNICHKEY